MLPRLPQRDACKAQRQLAAPGRGAARKARSVKTPDWRATTNAAVKLFDVAINFIVAKPHEHVDNFVRDIIVTRLLVASRVTIHLVHIDGRYHPPKLEVLGDVLLVEGVAVHEACRELR
eukprot:2188307-Heterocapsa_arctica.AAC.1